VRLTATYRLQLRPGFGFDEARALVPYLRELGISHLYLSPIMEARRGSTHGYDVVDPTRVSEQLGGEEAFRALAGAGLGVVLDVVPNHMAVSDENPFWAIPRSARRCSTGIRDRLVPALLHDRRARRRAVEDPEVFELTHRKTLELVATGSSTGCGSTIRTARRPARYLERLRERRARLGEKILEPGERLRDWPVEGRPGTSSRTTSPRCSSTRAGGAVDAVYEGLTGDRRRSQSVAAEAKLGWRAATCGARSTIAVAPR
jgi:(1->4)-alpha-D-glucan 1-alpha-D-glucosylmutase